MPTPARRTWTAIVRLLERDERVFAALLAVVMVGGLSTLGLALRPRFRIDLPSLAVGMVANRERRARVEVERLNAELAGTLTRLQAAQDELVVAERMATVGRLSLKVAHEVRNPIAAIGLNAELVGDLVKEREGEDMEEATSLVSAIREQVSALDALTEEYLAFARYPRPQYEEDSINEMVTTLVEFVRPLATRQDVALETTTDQALPPMAIDRTLLRQP